MSFNDCTIKAF